MDSIEKQLLLKISEDQMEATLHCTNGWSGEPVDETALKHFIVKEGIRTGIIKDAIDQVVAGTSIEVFPLLIAKGEAPVHGKDAEIEYFFETSSEGLKETEEYDFREVMKIPSVQKGTKLAVIHPPDLGKPGEDVLGNMVQADNGKEAVIKAGRNVYFNIEEQAFYACDSGQASVHDDKLHVYSVYEIKESVSMKTGNVQFAGSVVIHGDVPSGFRVTANGDVKVFGMVEAATITANGSIFIAEGLSGMKKGFIRAGKDVHLGYINQGTVLAGRDITVVNSILHSHCTASGKIESRNGNIIGGSASAASLIKAKEFGNRHNTRTDLHFGLDEENERRLEEYEKREKALHEEREKLSALGKQIEERDYQNNIRLRIAHLRQRNKYLQITKELESITIQIRQLEDLAGKEHDASLIASEAIYSNSVISFGKYKKQVDKDYGPISVVLDQNEIYFRPLG
ncbi:FapA family protein [Aciduricibacillus chroicocephali]|uniref:FapA family protein n=1 Tax=Aciduricibacillus chroicocephali TaxID=3054939 RepID=A0ABY9KYH6_9BACI|nr:FapA family protein [Bacillaceae bacterium 44XB]